jgi:hypothetical protein
MIAFDQVLLEFVGGNWMSIYVVITLAKGLALITPTVKDDTIITMLFQLFGVVRGGKVLDQAERGKEPQLDAASGGDKKKIDKTERLQMWEQIAQGDVLRPRAEKDGMCKQFISRPEDNDKMDEGKF